MLLATSWSDKKQRHRTTIPTLVISTVCFPVLLVTIVVAAVLASPLLPLFTLPIFLIGYPRPLRSWPGSVGKAASECGDTAFYKHVAVELAKVLHSSFARGSLGELFLIIDYNLSNNGLIIYPEYHVCLEFLRPAGTIRQPYSFIRAWDRLENVLDSTPPGRVGQLERRRRGNCTLSHN